MTETETQAQAPTPAKTPTQHTLLLPIAEAAPCGESAIYVSEYEDIQAQVAILNSPDPSVIDWLIVIERGEILFKSKSKDLTIACYLVVARFSKHGYAGLSEGLELLVLLVQTYWQAMHPGVKRERGRINALAWLENNLEKRINNIKPNDSDREYLQVIINLFSILNDELQKNIGGRIPVFTMIVNVVSKYAVEMQSVANTVIKDSAPVTPNASVIDKVQESNVQSTTTSQPLEETTADTNNISEVPVTNTIKPAATSAPISAGTTSATQTISHDLSGASDHEVTKATKAVQRSLLAIAQHAAEKSLADSRYYYFNRLAAWLTIKTDPEHNKQNMTPFKDVDSDVKSQLEQLLGVKDYPNLVSLAESTFVRHPFWLDGHRYTYLGLREMGTEYHNAALTVIAELNCLLTRFPKIIELHFKDGTSFASKPTQQWIASEVSIGSQGKSSKDAKPVVHDDTHLTSLKTSEKLFAMGQFDEAISELQLGLQGAKSERDKFILRLRQARYCLESGKTDAAIAQLNQLDIFASKISLSDWEPGLMADVLMLLLEANLQIINQSGKDTMAVITKVDDIYSRLCQCNIVEAMKIDPNLWKQKATTA